MIIKRIPRRRVLAVTGAALLIVAAATIEAVSLTNTVTDPSHSKYLWASVLWAVVLIEAGGLAVFISSPRARQRLLALHSCAWMRSPCS